MPCAGAPLGSGGYIRLRDVPGCLGLSEPRLHLQKVDEVKLLDPQVLEAQDRAGGLSHHPSHPLQGPFTGAVKRKQSTRRIRA